MSRTPPPGDEMEALVTLATMDLLASLSPEQRGVVFELVQVLLLSDEQRRVLHALAAGGVDAEEARSLLDRALASEDLENAAVRRRAVELGDQGRRHEERTLLESFRLLSPRLRRHVTDAVDALSTSNPTAADDAWRAAAAQLRNERRS